MIDKLNKWLGGAQKNRLLGVVGSVFVACFWYSVAQEEGFAQKTAELRSTATEIESPQGEIERSRKMVELWDKSLQELAERQEAYKKSLGEGRFTPENIRKTTIELIEEMRRWRRELSISMGVMNNIYLSLPSLQELRSKLLTDLVTADDVTARRIGFMETILVDMNRARELVPTIVSNIEEERKVIEAGSRQAFIEQIQEKARKEFNDRVRVFNARRATLHREIVLGSLAFGCMGACIGGAGGWLVWRWRRKRQKKAKGPEVSKRPGRTRPR